jgi:hypothetical protein
LFTKCAKSNKLKRNLELDSPFRTPTSFRGGESMTQARQVRRRVGRVGHFPPPKLAKIGY